MSEKWWDMSDDELDDLFREASDKAEIPFDSSALDKLRQKIDFQPIPQPKQSFKKRWLALAGLLIFFGVALLYTFSKVVSEKKLTTVNSTNKKGEIIESAISQKKNSTIKGYSMEKNKGELTNKKGTKIDFTLEKTSSNFEKSNSILDSKSLHNNSIDILSKTPIDEKIPTTTSKFNGSNSTIIKEGNNGNDVNILSSSKKNKKQLRLIKARFNSGQVYNSSIFQKVNVPISTTVIIPENKPVEEESIVKTNFYNVDLLTNKDTKSLETNIESESPTYVDAPPITMKQPKFSRFGIRLALAPDINSLEKLSTSSLGSSFGLLLEYSLSKKIIVQTGVTYSSKKYIGDFDYYHSWANNWMAYHPSKPIDVNGGCKIIDIPLNIRLNVYQKPRNTFFISTGISSYFMINETYTYDYAWTPSKTVNWSDKSSFYWSALNLSAGIERKFNKHLTFQIEPYLKTPLTNIGRGGVNLYSSGLLFSTKYEF